MAESASALSHFSLLSLKTAVFGSVSFCLQCRRKIKVMNYMRWHLSLENTGARKPENSSLLWNSKGAILTEVQYAFQVPSY